MLWHLLAALPERRKATDFLAYGDDIATTQTGQIVVVGSAHGEGDFAGSPLKGGPNSSLFLSARDKVGKAIWTQEFPVTASARAQRLVAARDGGLFLAGAFRGSIAFGPTVIKTEYSGKVSGANWESAAFVARFDANGKPIWAKSYSTVGYNSPLELAVAPKGGFVLTLTAAGLGGTIDVGGGNLLDCKNAKGNGLVVAGYSDTGEHRWSKAFIVSGINDAGAVTVTPNGRTVVAGSVGKDEPFGPKKEELGDTYVVAHGP